MGSYRIELNRHRESWVPFLTMTSVLLAFSLALPAEANQAETDFYSVRVVPEQPSPSDLVYLELDKLEDAPCDLQFAGAAIDNTNKIIWVSVEPLEVTLTGCNGPDSFRYLIGRLEKGGTYQVTLFEEVPFRGESIFRAENMTAVFPVNTTSAIGGFNAETPKHGSLQSGVGLVRGWVCDAKRIQIQFNSGQLHDVPYGSSRTDTEGVCGDIDNGYGMVITWSDLGLGQHTMTTYIDGIARSTVDFEVVGLGEGFFKDLEGTFDLGGFPTEHESVTVQWDEPLQNFIVISRD